MSSLERLFRTAPIASGDTIVFLGDYIDRGPDSKGVIDWILQLEKSVNVVPLRGNHEEMILGANEDPIQFHHWTACGGYETLVSYGLETTRHWIAGIPPAHWRFFQNTRGYLETERFIFVHGKADAELSMDQQSPIALFWEKCHQMKPHRSGKPVICGHTPHTDGRPGVYEFGACIDTNAARGGWLTCLDPASGKYWQANEQGETREGKLSFPP